MNKYFILALVGGVIVGGSLGTAQRYHHEYTQMEHMYETQQTCDRGRFDAAVMDQCHYLEYRYDLEYVCTNENADAVCAPEAK